MSTQVHFYITVYPTWSTANIFRTVSQQAIKSIILTHAKPYTNFGEQFNIFSISDIAV